MVVIVQRLLVFPFSQPPCMPPPDQMHERGTQCFSSSAKVRRLVSGGPGPDPRSQPLRVLPVLRSFPDGLSLQSQVRAASVSPLWLPTLCDLVTPPRGGFCFYLQVGRIVGVLCVLLTTTVS